MKKLIDSNLQIIEDLLVNRQAQIFLTMMAGWMSRRQQRVVEKGTLRECRYDLDGNLESDGQRSYAWDGENRLIKVNLLGNHPEERDEVTYAYDYEGRRVRKTRTHHVLGAEGWESTQLADHYYVYDGWNLIAEYDAQASHTLRRTYTWGLDLSLTLQGAGGVGGLLRSETHAPNAHQGAYYYTYDANGNVTEVLGGRGALAAHYEYDPFGNTIRQTGTYADANVFRFSTKYKDATTGLYYYGLRYYNPETGRWLSRDPIGERGGINLYAAGINTLINLIDYIGLDVCIKSFEESEGGSFKEDEVSEEELETWDKIEEQLSQSEEGRELLDKIHDPDYELQVDSIPGGEPGGTYIDENSGNITMDLHDPSGISPETRENMFQEAMNDGHVTGREDFNNQVSQEPGVIAGHEMGHAVNNQRDEPYGNNVENTENPIREGIGESPRENYRDTPIPNT